MWKTLLLCIVLGIPCTTTLADTPAAIQVGVRRNLLIDDFLIQRMEGELALRLHHPRPRELAIVHDEAWEGTGCGYHSVFRDGDVYRMYYKAWHLRVSEGKLDGGAHPLYCCYAESDDGIHWRKPHLQQHAFGGQRANNIVMASGVVGDLHVDPGHPAVFKDANPDAPAEARYKAILRSSKPNGLLVFQSPDGLHWSPFHDAPILRLQGAFDSQNLAFWDPRIGKYRAYWRVFTAGTITDDQWKPAGYRAIRTAVSDNLVDWKQATNLTYVDSPEVQLYTNAVQVYHRAPHVLIGFPTRYIDRGPSATMQQLPDVKNRKLRASANPRYGYALTDGLFMTSRDGVHFKRWNESLLRPGPERPGTWHYGAHYLAWGVVETASELPGAPAELSLYATENYWHGKGSALRRYTLRLDGFVSASATARGGELLTKTMTFDGSRLDLNFASSAAGTLRVEIQNAAGEPLPGYALKDCIPQFGDSVARSVRWKEHADVQELVGQPVRLRFVLQDADLYSFQFVKQTKEKASP